MATIKPADPLSFRLMALPLDNGMVTISGLSLKEFIQFAWGNVGVGVGLHPQLVSGGPGWVDHDKYNIVAKSEAGHIPSRDGGAPFSLPVIGLHIPGRNVSMTQLADLLQAIIPLTDKDRDDRPVIDQTGLAGKFDFDLAWSGDPTLTRGLGGPPSDSSSAPDLFTAVQEQLGLKLELRRAPMEILVIDHAERPSEN